MTVYRTAVLAILIVAGSVRADESPSNENGRKKALITISKETTFITEPLTKDGRIDYCAAFDQQMRAGVTVENNAAVVLVQTFGPSIVNSEARADFFQRLGIDPLPEQGDYFVTMEQFAASEGEDIDDLNSRAARCWTRPWQATAEPMLAKWIASNEGALARICQASRRDKLYMPTVLPPDADSIMPKLISMLLPGISELRGAVRALSARAMLRLGQGDVQGAQDDLMTIHRLANLTGQCPLLVEKLISYSFEAIACSGHYAIAQSGKLSAGEALEARRALEELPAVSAAVDALNLGERYSYLDAAQLLAHNGLDSIRKLNHPEPERTKSFLGSIPTGAAINFDLVLKMGNEIFDRAVRIMQVPDHGERSAMYSDLWEEMYRLADGSRQPKAMAMALLGGRLRDQLGKATGGMLLSMLLPALEAINTAETRTKTQRDLARLTFALAAYRAEHQRFPDTLEHLQPNYIAQVPADPFSPDPLRYRPQGKGYLLYSIGHDGDDDGGRNRESEPPGDDILVRFDPELE